MSTLADAPVLVEPAYLSVPAHAVGTYGDIVADVADMYGRPVDPEQRLAVDAICSYAAGGLWAALEGCIVEGRQNGKTGGVLLPIVLTDLFIWDADAISWTAHLFKTSRKAFEDVKSIIDGTPEFSRRVKKITEANGEEGVELHNGAKLEFLARSKGAGKGLGGKRIVLDEALFLPATSLGALIPTLSARPNPQVLYGSSAGVAESVHLRNLRDRGQAGGDPSLAYAEWSTPRGGCRLGDQCTHVYGIAGCALDDETRWPKANHAITRGRITIGFVRAERRTLPPEEFARERMGWWDDPAGAERPISADAWGRHADQPKRINRGAAPVFCPDIAPHMKAAAIAVAYERRRNRPHLELADHRAGAAWLVARCKQLHRKYPNATWVAAADGAIGAVLPDLEELGIDFVTFSGPDMGRATAHLEGLVDDTGFTHSGDEAFIVALGGAVKRDIGDGLWTWGRRKSTSDICPMVAGTGALWGLEQIGSYDPTDHLY